ncbi:alpha/beta hydrolase [Actinomyces sp. B33]|uniref:alpha/beta hydrolase n=1 Tax=Actinomyces sp. B33 TaxID=2942131 RepID=UPI0023408A40|nr:alpha/beta hydrolase [Actinomyces sp. B33]MDC4232344.1 alpha/beta hydrolase [Actinomyces sp. B33]
MRARRRPRFYAPRRVPQAFAPAHVRLRLLPLAPALAATVVVGMISEAALVPDAWRSGAGSRAQAMGADISQRYQRLFFDEPGLDTLFVRGLASTAKAATAIGRAALRLSRSIGVDRERAAAILPLLPRRGYDILMTAMLSVGTAVGALRGGDIHIAALYDSAAEPPVLEPPAGHARPHLRRVDPPASLRDMCADIDDMYWAMTDGQPLKITRVGRGPRRRWLVSVPGTAHMDFPSNANPADMESNIREMLGMASGMRVGVIRALHRAMEIDGVDPRDRAREPVLICGHSQAGAIAVALASTPPEAAGVNVVGILAVGAPARRTRLRPDVTMVAVQHDQDVVPAMDGSPDRDPDQRVRIGRSLVRPRRDPLYYAHSSATYTETVRQLERKTAVAPWGRAAQAVTALQRMLPADGEETRVGVYEVWQDLLEPVARDRLDAFLSLDLSASYEPVDYESDYRPAPLIDLSRPDRRRPARTDAGGRAAPADGAQEEREDRRADGRPDRCPTREDDAP